MGRKPNPARREELLRATVRYLEREGLAGLSLRPLSAAVGVSPRTLLYHFGSKEGLLAAALDAAPALRRGVDEFVSSERPLFERLLRLWERTTEPAARRYLRLFFEVYAAALREPRRYAAFRKSVVARWLDTVRPLLENEGLDPASATARATELIALHHGCALDLLATGDLKRVDAAYRARLAELEAQVSQAGGPAKSAGLH